MAEPQSVLDQLPDQHILDQLPDQTGSDESMLSKIGHRLLDVNYGTNNTPLVGPGNAKIPGVESAGKYLQNKLVNSGNYYLGALGGLLGYGSEFLSDAPSPMNSAPGPTNGATGALKDRLEQIPKQILEEPKPKVPLQLKASPTRGLELPPAKTENFPSIPGWHGTPTEVWKGGPSRPYGGMVESTNQPGIEAAIGDVARQSWPRSPEGKFVPNWYLGDPQLPYELPSAVNPERSTNYPQPDKPVIDITPTKGENTYAKVKELAPDSTPLNLKEKLGISTPTKLAESELPNNQSSLKMLINTPKSIMASTDLSAPLRQGMPLITRKEWWTSLKPMVKAMTSEDAYQAIQTSIKEHPNFDLMKSAKLALTDTTEKGPREEAFLNSYAEKIPGIGPIIRASDRAYTGFLNKLRADTFNSLLEDASNLGYAKEEIAPKIAKYVNVSTGRGSLGQFEKYADDLNTALFSPRMMASRLTMLNPMYYADQPAFLRKEALRSLLSVTGAGTLFTGLGTLAGGHTSLDPTNTDFGKLRIGNTRVDPYAGFQQYVVAATRLMKGETTSSVSGKTQVMGQGYKAPDRLDTIGRFMRNKESPALSFVHDMITQKGSDGKPIQLSNEVISRITPMMIQDLQDLAKEDPKLLPLGIFGNFGMGVQTYSK